MCKSTDEHKYVLFSSLSTVSSSPRGSRRRSALPARTPIIELTDSRQQGRTAAASDSRVRHTHTHMMAERKRSVVWSYFTTANENLANCDVCKKAVRYCGHFVLLIFMVALYICKSKTFISL